MKIFYLTSRIPYPIDKGDKLRAFHQLRLLAKEHEVYLFSLDDECRDDVDLEKLKEISAKVKVIKLPKIKIMENLIKGMFSSIPFQNSFYYSSSIKKIIDREINQFKPDIIFCQLIRMGEYVKDINKTKVIDYIDVLSKGLERRKNNCNLLLKPVLFSEHKRVVNYEANAFDSFGNGIIITDNDRAELKFSNKHEVEVVPNGIQVDHFKDLKRNKDIDVMFAGNMSYAPNVDAVIYFTEHVFPLLLKKKPDLKFYIVGASPSAKIKKLASEKIIVTGWVDDLREYYSRAKVFVAPMQIGTGMQNKILEAMSMSLPCVISSIAQGGIKANDKENVLIAESKQEYVDAIVNILDNKEVADKLSVNARKFVSENFNWDAIGNKLNSYLNKILNGTRKNK